MKYFFSIIFVAALSISAAWGQQSFDWKSQKVTFPKSNLKAMNVVNDTTTLLVGYDHTFLRSKDQGSSWETIPIIDPEFDFGDMGMNSSGVGYVLAGDKKIMDNPSSSREIDVYIDGLLLYTEDFGKTWAHFDIAEIGNESDPTIDPNAPGCYGRHFYSVEVLEDGTVYLGMNWYHYESKDAPKVSYYGVLKSTDGNSWTTLPSNNKLVNAIEATDTKVYYGGQKNFYVEDMAGNTTDLYNILEDAAGSDPYIFDFHIVSEDLVYIITSTDGIAYTTDQGATITRIASGPGGGNDMIQIDTNTIMVLGSSSKSKLSIDAGSTWIDYYPDETCFDIAGVFNDSIVALGKGDLVKIAVADAKAGNLVWKKQAINNNENLHQMHIIDDSTAILAGYAEEIKRTTDAGLSWNPVELPVLWNDEGPQYDFSSISTKEEDSWACTRRIYTVDFPHSWPGSDVYGSGLILYSPDYWNTWNIIDPTTIGTGTDPSKNPNVEGCYGISPECIECIDANTAFVYIRWIDSTATYENKVSQYGVFKTSDAGASWEIITGDIDHSYITDIHFIDANTGYIVGKDFFYKTSDQGATLTNMFPNLIACPDAPSDGEIYINSFEYINENEWYIVSTNDGVYATNDGGATYTKLGAMKGGNGLYKHNDSTLVVLGVTSKTKISWDYGANWTDCRATESLWAVGGILQDSLVGLAKGDIFRIALSNLDAPSSEADILTFVLPDEAAAATINADLHVIDINVVSGTDVSNYTPSEITISEGASISPAPDAPQDFTQPVVYTVTAEDTKTEIEWTVTIHGALISTEKLNREIRLYPNPVSHTLHLSNISGVERIAIVSITGQKVFECDTQSSDLAVNIEGLNDGIYFINFFDKKNKVECKKFVKR